MLNNKGRKILVSIITPTLNRAQFLERNILSIKNQDYPFIEHVVVDGASTDNTIEILRKYEGTYNLKWISEKDRGCANAMNKGFKMAKGDIFCWLDSDDIYLPGTIRKIVEIFQKYPNVDVVFGNMFIIDQSDKIIDYIKCTEFDGEALLYTGMILNPQSTFWRRSLHKNLNGLDQKYLRCADYDFFLRMALSEAKFYHIRDFLAAYRHHSQQLSKSVELCRREGSKIAYKYFDENLTIRSLEWKKRKILVRRALQYIKQGDIWYVLRGILRRIGILHTTYD